MYKEAIIFAVGLGLGAFIGYKYAEKKLTELNERDIKELQNYYDKLLKDDFEEKEGKNDEKLPENDLQNSIDNSSNSYEKVVVDVMKASLNPPIVEQPKENRVIISSDEFLEENNYDKETIYYYEEDETFCSPEYEIMPDAIDLIGKENMDNVGMFEERTLYVRNELFGKDIEIIFFDEAYSDVAGE